MVPSPTYLAIAVMPPSGTRIRPVEKLATALATCAPESAIYGRCVVADYNNVFKDKCLNEFMRLKDCYIVRRRPPIYLFMNAADLKAESSKAEILEFIRYRFCFFSIGLLNASSLWKIASVF